MHLNYSVSTCEFFFGEEAGYVCSAVQLSVILYRIKIYKNWQTPTHKMIIHACLDKHTIIAIK